MGRRPATTRRHPPEQAVDHLRRADPVLARIISAYPDFEPRAWLADLTPMGGFQALVFQVIGQQLSVGATRRILTRLMECFGGELPNPAQVLDVDPAPSSARCIAAALQATPAPITSTSA